MCVFHDTHLGTMQFVTTVQTDYVYKERFCVRSNGVTNNKMSTKYKVAGHKLLSQSLALRSVTQTNIFFHVFALLTIAFIYSG